MIRTPIAPGALARSDAKPALTAVLDAWTEPGVSPAWHEEMQRLVSRAMPVLAFALDRLAREAGRR